MSADEIKFVAALIIFLVGLGGRADAIRA